VVALDAADEPLAIVVDLHQWSLALRAAWLLGHTSTPLDGCVGPFSKRLAFAGALLLGLSTAALAVTGEFDNMCTEGLALNKDIKTDCSINTTIKGKTYCFGSEQAKIDFMKDPEGNLAEAQAYYSSTHKKM
jgi:YHS domain-containing protein